VCVSVRVFLLITSVPVVILPFRTSRANYVSKCCIVFLCPRFISGPEEGAPGTRCPVLTAHEARRTPATVLDVRVKIKPPPAMEIEPGPPVVQRSPNETRSVRNTKQPAMFLWPGECPAYERHQRTDSGWPLHRVFLLPTDSIKGLTITPSI
jgi:hypothetical protein